MAYTSTDLNVAGTTEAAFAFYKSVFGTEFVAGIMRIGDVPPEAGQPSMSDAQKQMVVNVALPITGGHILMGTNATAETGFTLVQGKTSISRSGWTAAKRLTPFPRGCPRAVRPRCQCRRCSGTTTTARWSIGSAPTG